MKRVKAKLGLRQRRRILCCVCALCVFASSMFTGCGVSTGAGNVFRIGKLGCSIKEAKILLVNYQNQYRDVYGVDLWRTTGDTREELEVYIKDSTISELAEIYMLAYICQDQDLALTDEEEAHVAAAAEAYFSSLNETEKVYLDVSEKDVKNLYQTYAMAKKVIHVLTEHVEQEVSDDEARIMSVMQIYTTSEDMADLAYQKLNAGTAFASVAAAYNKAEETVLTVARADVPTEAEAELFSLANGEYTSVIGTEDGYYIYYCENNYEEALTQKNKAVVLQQRMEDAVSATYDTYAATTDTKLYQDKWNAVSLDTDEKLSTTSFFEVFESYCGADYEK